MRPSTELQRVTRPCARAAAPPRAPTGTGPTADTGSAADTGRAAADGRAAGACAERRRYAPCGAVVVRDLHGQRRDSGKFPLDGPCEHSGLWLGDRWGRPLS